MLKKLLFLTNMLIVLSFAGCTSFNETYKPLYQVKPEVKSLKGQ